MTQQSEKNKMITGRKAIYVFMHPERTEVLNFNNWWFEEVCPAYDKDWNALMPVVEKIESLGLYEVLIKRPYVKIKCFDPFNMKDIAAVGIPPAKSKIDAVYQAIIQFITYYNSINKTTPRDERPPARPPV